MALPFVGVDGEGGDITRDGFTHHRYTMLRAGDSYVVDDGSWDWHLRFLAEQAKRRILVAYFFDYDTTMMLRDMEEEKIRALVAGAEVQWGPYTLAYRPRKELVVKSHHRVTTVNDVGTFFQCKFTTALKRWNIGTDEQRRIIEEGKEGRAHFGELTPETIFYNGMETNLLEELMDKFRRTCEIIGYLPTRWQGPGQLAKAMFRKHNIPRTVALPEPPPGLWEMAQAAYYGGRFETSLVGPVRVPVDGWDINSAYPYVATLLPCLLHGRWEPVRGHGQIGSLVASGQLVVSHVNYDHDKERQWYSLPHRTHDGSIRFPRRGSGWYWSPELRAGCTNGLRATYSHGFLFIPGCDCKPFDFMHRLYSVRQGIGKSEAGITLKLAMNSAYGVTAQSVGKAPYANPVWAGLFTSYTRAILMGAVSQSPYDVYMLATDGLYCRSGSLALKESDTLGGWSRTHYPDGMHIVQPGVYFTNSKADPKTRGVSLNAILANEQALRAAWTGNAGDGLDISLRQFIGLRLGAARDNFPTIGEWLPVTKRVGYDWSTKRRPNVLRHCYEGDRTLPYPGSTDEWSEPYSRIIGGNLARNMERLEWEDTPEWAMTLTDVL